MSEIYMDDVTDLDSLERWLEQKTERATMSDHLSFTRDERLGKLTVHFLDGDHMNTPAMLVRAIQGTHLEIDYLSVENSGAPNGIPTIRVVNPRAV